MKSVKNEYKTLKSLPSKLKNNLNVLFNSRSGEKNYQGLPSLNFEWQNGVIAKNYLKHYQKYHKISQTELTDKIPMMYPLMLSSLLNYKIMSHKYFPLKLRFTLNTFNEIIQYRAMNINEAMTFQSSISNEVVMQKGLEYEITTKLLIDNQLVWQTINTFSCKGNFPNKTDQKLKSLASLEKPKVIADYTIPKVGFRYALISGDFNPLHHRDLFSKFSGYEASFSQPLLAIALAQSALPKNSLPYPKKMSMALKGPIYYKKQVLIKSNDQLANANQVDLFSHGNDRPSICLRIEEV